MTTQEINKILITICEQNIALMQEISLLMGDRRKPSSDFIADYITSELIKNSVLLEGLIKYGPNETPSKAVG